MDCLAGRKTSGNLTGDIRLNGHPKDAQTFARISGYVEQQDVHLPQASVREALAFSARLRLPMDVEASQRDTFVEEVLQLVELDRIAGAHVGVPGESGLSVEQRKRLTLAVELVANPSIVFLDEPTSGLDSRSASIVVAAIRNTVDTGRTVVCTVHQPSITVFEVRSCSLHSMHVDDALVFLYATLFYLDQDFPHSYCY
jgi:ABC-type multidrug transport system ATPase subunit